MTDAKLTPYEVMKKTFDAIDDEERACKELGIKIAYTKYGGCSFQELHYIDTGVYVSRSNCINTLTDVIDWLMREVAKHNDNSEVLNDE